MVHCLRKAASVLAILVIASSLAYAQDTSSLSGRVVDVQDGAIPGATVEVKSLATGVTYNTVTSLQGTFLIPGVSAGRYTVTISLQGFKTAILNDVVVNVAVPASVRAILEVGGLTETVVVNAAGEVVQTQSSAVAQTVNLRQIQNLPLASRNTLDFITFLPGVNTPGGNRDSTINGLPQSVINITLDGINVQDNTLKSTDGFFTIVQPRLDSVEEVTVSTAAQGAESSGQGAVQIRFVTRSGTNSYTGSGYHTYRNDKLNENTWFNKRDAVSKPELLQNQPGVRVGGPIMLPKLFDGRGRAFFFVNYEEFRQPQDVTRTRTVLSPQAQAGVFRYEAGGGVRTVDLYALALANGQLATGDPTILQLLADIRSATGTTGSITDQTDPNLQRYSFNVAQRSFNRYPTVRIDVNASTRHRISGSLNWHTFGSFPDTLNNRDPVFPGFPVAGNQLSERINVSTSLRSTLGSRLVNELRVGGSGAPVKFSNELTPSLWGGSSVADQGGFQLGISAAGISNASSGPTPSSRNAKTLLVENTLSLTTGSHAFSFGGAWTQVDIWLANQTLLPSLGFGIATGDSAEGIFNTTNFPGASTTNLNAARALYAVLTGRVNSISGNAGLSEATGEYVYHGERFQRGRMREMDLYASDNWRLRSNLTINYGVRYGLQFPFSASNNSYSTATIEDVWGVTGYQPGCELSNATPETCSLFKPGVLNGKVPTFVNLGKGVKAYNVDWDNIAPSVGFNWTPTSSNAFLDRLMGRQGDFSIRGAWSRGFSREGMTNFTGVFGGNPGVLIDATRSPALGNLGTLPVLLRETSRLGPPAFAATPNYPLSDTITGDVSIIDPNLQVAYADSWSLGVQRALGRTMAVEVRYVGTLARQLLRVYNYNEANIVENGFLQEFRNAQANLQSHIASGCVGAACSFAYRGPDTGTVPLPIYLAYFSGTPAGLAGSAAAYTSTLFRNSNFVNPLAQFNPNPFTPAGTNSNTGLAGDPTRRANAAAAGLPVNFFLVNPSLQGGANVTGNGDTTSYHSMQVELRRRLSNGLQFQSSYVYGRGYQSVFTSFRKSRFDVEDGGGEGNVVHALKATWLYELPFGQGKRWGNSFGPIMERLVGGWQIHGTTRVQSGRLIDFGNVRMVGFDKNDLRDMFQLRIDSNQRVWMLPQAVIDETVKAFNVSATSATGYGSLGPPSGQYFAPANGPACIEVAPGFGDCGARSVVVRGPMFKTMDISLTKLVPLAGRTRAEFRFELLNAFNVVNFTPISGVGSTTASGYELTGADTARIVQIVTRISW